MRHNDPTNTDLYTSSIIHKYGDTPNVPTDCKTIYDIFSRQGSSLIIDCLAEKLATNCQKFKLQQSEVEILKNHIVNELINAIDERA
jgi:hypothetical protein